MAGIARNQPDLLRHLPELVDHDRSHLFDVLGARELVGIGEQVSFERLGFGCQIGDEIGRVSAM